MIKIADKGTRVIATIADDYFTKLEPVITKAVQVNMPTRQAGYILRRLKQIITGTPQELLRLHNNYRRFCSTNQLSARRGIKKAFSYKNFLQRKSYNAYNLAKSLGINVCPYCNRQYIFTVSDAQRGITRPEFDHFFLQEQYPLLSLSFYNLIPSCVICNSRLKGKRNFQLATHLHPYLHGFEDDMTFGYTPNSTRAASGLDDDLRITVQYTIAAANYTNIRGNCDAFHIENIYQDHKDIVREVIRKRYTTGGRYLQQLANAIPAMHTSHAELYQLAFANHFLEIDFERRPLAKLTKDIFNSLNFQLP